jgi:hypothetical protein
MLGLAWDSLWGAIISPQQEADRKRLAWQAEHDALLSTIATWVGEPPKLGSLGGGRFEQGIDFDLGLRFTRNGEPYDPHRSKVSH